MATRQPRPPSRFSAIRRRSSGSRRWRRSRDRGWKVLLVAKTRFAAADVAVYDNESGQQSVGCAKWRRAAIDTIITRRASVVLTANSVGYVWPAVGDSALPAVTLPAWEAGLARTLDEFGIHGVTPAIILDTPHLHANVSRFVSLAQAGSAMSMAVAQPSGATHSARCRRRRAPRRGHAARRARDRSDGPSLRYHHVLARDRWSHCVFR